MYYLIRAILIVIIASIRSLLLKDRVRKSRLQVRKLPVVVIILLLSGLIIFPYENLVYSFPSAESAFKYSHFEKVLFKVEGKHSAQIFTSKYISWIPRDSSGWKLGLLSVPTYKKNFDLEFKKGRIFFEIFQYSFVNDYYITVDYWNNSSIISQISDDRNSTFKMVDHSTLSSEIKNYTFYTCIQDINKGYSIFIDGEEIVIVE